MPEKKQSKWGLYVAAAVVLIAVLVGVIGLLTSRGRGQAQPAPAASASTHPLATASSTPTDGPCNAPAGTMTAAPSDIKWVTSAGISWVTSPSLGPTSKKDGFPVCFSQSPVGAALAATTYGFESYKLNAYDVDQFYVVPSAGKTKLLSQDHSSGETAAQDQQTFLSNGLSLAGFRIDQYTSTSAYVEIVIRQPDAATGYRGIPVSLTWTAGDWRVEVGSDGTFPPAVDVNAGQFTQWSK